MPEFLNKCKENMTILLKNMEGSDRGERKEQTKDGEEERKSAHRRLNQDYFYNLRDIYLKLLSKAAEKECSEHGRAQWGSETKGFWMKTVASDLLALEGIWAIPLWEVRPGKT